MTDATTLSGRDLAGTIRTETAARANQLTEAGTRANLAVLVATEDDAAAGYARSIASSAGKVGIACQLIEPGPDPSREQMAEVLVELSRREDVHGIIVQTPLPVGTTLRELGCHIEAGKDVDGANPLSLGRLVVGLPAFAPATAEAVVALLDHHRVALVGAHVVIVGRSIVVGKPLAHLLLARDATVTICHSLTKGLASTTRQADILVVAAGSPRLVTAEHVKAGMVVIDVGTNAAPNGGLVGDVHVGSVSGIVGALSPVPGGVGPVTTALLLRHTIQAAEGTAAGL